MARQEADAGRLMVEFLTRLHIGDYVAIDFTAESGEYGECANLRESLLQGESCEFCALALAGSVVSTRWKYCHVATCSSWVNRAQVAPTLSLL